MAWKYSLDARNEKLLHNYCGKNYLTKQRYQRMWCRKKNNIEVNLGEKGCEDVGSA
jgi:hypothetical protein